MVKEFKAEDLIGVIRMEVQILKPMGGGIWNTDEDVGKGLKANFDELLQY